eukprot:CAMPEP_0171454270 /NCGR_PEP_ID=MMETSP0945-20130129/1624_1 /TAXON_ID=109269 /ORGANISM="Vaucheria litorea, Strain CCMP2940" /LENGTH=621 /DNA_ID=CAMNT_0011979261 /DNA_START=385 /DNA_END=2250 /DNA_ORIENTATION=-
MQSEIEKDKNEASREKFKRFTSFPHPMPVHYFSNPMFPVSHLKSSPPTSNLPLEMSAAPPIPSLVNTPSSYMMEKEIVLNQSEKNSKILHNNNNDALKNNPEAFYDFVPESVTAENYSPEFQFSPSSSINYDVRKYMTDAIEDTPKMGISCSLGPETSASHKTATFFGENFAVDDAQKSSASNQQTLQNSLNDSSKKSFGSSRFGKERVKPDKGKSRVNYGKGKARQIMQDAIKLCEAIDDGYSVVLTENEGPSEEEAEKAAICLTSKREISEYFGIAWSTLHPRLVGKVDQDTGASVRKIRLPDSTEQMLAQRVLWMLDHSVPLNWNGMKVCANSLAELHGLNDYRAEENWVKRMKYRFPGLAARSDSYLHLANADDLENHATVDKAKAASEEKKEMSDVENRMSGFFSGIKAGSVDEYFLLHLNVIVENYTQLKESSKHHTRQMELQNRQQLLLKRSIHLPIHKVKPKVTVSVPKSGAIPVHWMIPLGSSNENDSSKIIGNKKRPASLSFPCENFEKEEKRTRKHIESQTMEFLSRLGYSNYSNKCVSVKAMRRFVMRNQALLQQGCPSVSQMQQDRKNLLSILDVAMHMSLSDRGGSDWVVEDPQQIDSAVSPIKLAI